jgi:hypothetical protein
MMLMFDVDLKKKSNVSFVSHTVFCVIQYRLINYKSIK